MRYHVRLPALAIIFVLLVSACGGGATPSPSTGGSSTAPSTAASAPAESAAASVGASGSQAASAGQGIDDGTKITLWTRAATEARVRPIVTAYNSSHKNQIDLTVVPTDDYQAKVGAAAGSNGLPDLFSADVVFMPNWTSQGLFQDITSELKALPYFSSIAKSHIDVATLNGKIYAVPHKLDSSVLFYNKDLFKKAGLDPNTPPKNFAD